MRKGVKPRIIFLQIISFKEKNNYRIHSGIVSIILFQIPEKCSNIIRTVLKVLEQKSISVRPFQKSYIQIISFKEKK